MKILLSLNALMLFSAVAISQPVYESLFFPYAGIAGAHADPIDAQNSDEGASGADVVWDFQHWEPDVETSVSWFQTLPWVMEVPFLFPDANFGWQFYDTMMREEYYLRDQNSLSLVGEYMGGNVFNYTNPHLLRVAPLMYLDTFTDTYRAVTNSSAIWPQTKSGNRTTVYDAYGTLGIRGEWHPNTIRLRTDQVWTDSIFYGAGSLLVQRFDRTSYEWYFIDKCGPDASIHYTTIHTQNWVLGTYLDTSTTQQVHRSMLDGCIHVSTEEAKGLSGIQFALSGSNPVHEDLSLVLQSETVGRKLKLEVFDAHGKLLDSRSLTTMGGEEKVEIPVDQLASGMYVVVLSDGKGRLSRRWVKM